MPVTLKRHRHFWFSVGDQASLRRSRKALAAVKPPPSIMISGAPPVAGMVLESSAPTGSVAAGAPVEAVAVAVVAVSAAGGAVRFGWA